MLKTSLAAAAIATLGLTATSHSATVRIDCAYGELTVGRIADGECTARIPLPTPRPEAVSAMQEIPAAPKQALVKPEYIEFTTDGGETKLIRLVGPRFLPENEMDLRSHAAAHPGKSAFSRALAYLGFGTPESTVAVEGVKEARLEVVAENVSN